MKKQASIFVISRNTLKNQNLNLETTKHRLETVYCVFIVSLPQAESKSTFMNAKSNCWLYNLCQND